MGCCGDDDGSAEEKKGEPLKYDPTFNGPIKNRGCTDILCCLLFFIFIIGLVGVSVFAFIHGDPTMLIYPTNSEGQMCGVGPNQDKPNLFFFDFLTCARMGLSVAIEGCSTPQVCVKKCPTTYWAFAQQVALESTLGSSAISSRSDMICKPGIDPTVEPYRSKTVLELVQNEDCAPYYIPESSFVGRCIPSIIDKILDTGVEVAMKAKNFTLQTANNQTVTDKKLGEASKYMAQFLSAVEVGEQVLSDVKSAWWMILIGLAISAIIALIWILIMRWVAGCMVWTSFFLFTLIFGFATGYSFYHWNKIKNEPGANGNYYFTTNFSYYLALANTWLAFGIIAGVILLIILLILIFLCGRIRIAIALIEETSRAIGNMMLTLLFPLIPFIMQLVIFGYWGLVTVFLASTGRAQYQTRLNDTNSTSISDQIKNIIDCAPAPNGTLSNFCQFVKYGGDQYTIYLQIFNLFMLFWLVNFVIGFGQMALAGAFASYYWAFSKPKDIPMFPLASSVWRAFRYHLGSIAFGSLLIAIVQIIRAILEYLDRKMKGSENPVAKFLMKCLKCFFWCLEKFIKFINRNAYIMIAVYGKNFCTSAKEAFFLLLRNCVRVVVVDKVADFILFVSKLVITAAATGLAYAFFSGQIDVEYIKNYQPNLNYYFIPVIIVGLGAYVIAHCFFSVYHMGVDTLFLCFLQDLEVNDGSADKPYFMSKSLMGILGKNNKKPKTEEEKSEKK